MYGYLTIVISVISLSFIIYLFISTTKAHQRIAKLERSILIYHNIEQRLDNALMLQNELKEELHSYLLSKTND